MNSEDIAIRMKDCGVWSPKRVRTSVDIRFGRHLDIFASFAGKIKLRKNNKRVLFIAKTGLQVMNK